MLLSRQSPVFNFRLVACLGLLCLCFAVGTSTWFTLIQQREAEKAHLQLAAETLLANLSQFLYQSEEFRQSKELTPQIHSLFQQIEKDTSTLFTALYWPHENLLVSGSGHVDGEFIFSSEFLHKLLFEGRARGHFIFEGKKAYVYGKAIDSVTDLENSSLKASLAKPYLIIGLDETQILEPYALFQRNAFFQALYLFFAAVSLWWLLLAYFKQWEKAQRSRYLEDFQTVLLDNLPDGLLIIKELSHGLLIQSVNPMCEKLLSCNSSVLVNSGPSALGEKLHSTLVDEQGKLRVLSEWQEFNLEDKYLEWRSLPVQGQNVYMVLFRDKTQHKKMEKQLASAEKLAAIGSLAAGVAHEVRNPLSALRGFAQYFAKKLHDKEPDATYANTMVLEADRLNRVITDLLFLAKPHSLELSKIYLEDICSELELLLHDDFAKERIQFAKLFSVSFIWADRDTFKQILLNLFLNSFAAIKDVTREEQRRIEIRSGQGANLRWIEFRDFGQGMNREILARACEPFYTSKKRGTGLGLALVERIMHEHGGYLFLTSAEDKGTTIHLYFPDKEEESSHE